MTKPKEDVKHQSPKVKGQTPVPASGSVSEATKALQREKERAKTDTHCCGECRFYDNSTERQFHRDGIRKGLVETRAICRAPKEKAKSSLHLVRKESNKPCFEVSVYVVPVKEKKTEEQEMPAKARTHKASDKEKATRAVATNGLTGDTKVLEQNGHDKKVVVKKIAEH